MANENFDFDCVPSGYTLCFNDSCPLSQQCLRHLAGKHVPDHLTKGMSVYPNAYADGQCDHFKQIRVVRAARGFGDILAKVRRNDYSPMRSRLIMILGNRLRLHMTRYQNRYRYLVMSLPLCGNAVTSMW